MPWKTIVVDVQNIPPGTFVFLSLEELCDFAVSAGTQVNPLLKMFLSYPVGQKEKLQRETGHEVSMALSALVIQGSLLLEKQLRFMK